MVGVVKLLVVDHYDCFFKRAQDLLVLLGHGPDCPDLLGCLSDLNVESLGLVSKTSHHINVKGQEREH